MSRKCYRCDKLLTRLEEKSEDATFKLEDGLKFPTVHSRCYLCILKSQVRSWELKDEEVPKPVPDTFHLQTIETDFQKFIRESREDMYSTLHIDPTCV